MHTTSVSLLDRLGHAGDHDAWQRFVRLYTPLLFSWSCGAGLQETDAADVVQDVLIVVFRKLPHFNRRGDGSFRKWLRTVLTNKVRDHWKRRPLDVHDGQTVPDLASDGLDELEESEYRRHIIGRALRLIQVDFQPASWRAFWEAVVNGRAPGEIAKELGISAGAVYSARFRVVTRLRQELDGLLD